MLAPREAAGRPAKGSQAKLRRTLSQDDNEVAAKEVQIGTLRGDIDALRMRIILLGRRIDELWRGRVETEQAWLREKSGRQAKVEQGSRHLGYGLDIEANLRVCATETECARLREEKEALEAAKKKNEREIIELRDKLSEYCRRLTSGGHLDPLLYRPFVPDIADYSIGGMCQRRKSDNAASRRRRRGGI
ncbi:hypothetical protein NMY22_g19345 [Coprinellus aureogranulatus]|nr:hypothetical protein NMY22_g19345 [Coprinellus aureogranulatus]